MPLTPSGVFYPDDNTDMSLSGIMAQMATSIDNLVGNTGRVTFTPTVPAGLTITRPFFYQKFGKLVMLTGSVSGAAGVHQISGLPEAIRPNYTYLFILGRDSPPSGTVGRAVIFPTGNLDITIPPGGSPSDSFLIATTYMVPN